LPGFADLGERDLARVAFARQGHTASRCRRTEAAVVECSVAGQAERICNVLVLTELLS